MNNRIIKFRVWDIKKNYFWYPRPSGDTIFNEVFDDEYSICQQFTGLLDKNGKEIYEGDIVKTKHYEDWNDTEGFDLIHTVKWCNIHVGWRGFTDKMTEKHAGLGLPSPIEIIGDIFELPVDK